MKLSSFCNYSQHQPGLRLMTGHGCWHQTNPRRLLNSQVPGAVWSCTRAFWHICSICFLLALSHNLICSSAVAHLLSCWQTFEKILSAAAQVVNLDMWVMSPILYFPWHDPRVSLVTVDYEWKEFPHTLNYIRAFPVLQQPFLNCGIFRSCCFMCVAQ